MQHQLDTHSVEALRRLTRGNLPLRMRFDSALHRSLNDLLLVHSIDIHEAINDGLQGRLTCVGIDADLELADFVGACVTLQIVTARGTLRRIAALISAMRRGESDGALTVYQLELADPLRVLQQRRGTRVFRAASAVDVTCIVLDDLRADCVPLRAAFDYALWLDRAQFPQREFTLQANEPVASFLQRTWKRAGISYFFRPPAEGADRPLQLVLFDDARRLEPNPAGPLRHHRHDGTEQADSIVQWSEVCRLASARTFRHSWDYRGPRMNASAAQAAVARGAAEEFAASLTDVRIEAPHAGDNYADYARLTALRAQRDDYESAQVEGESGCRDLALGEYHAVAGPPALPAAGHEFVFVEIRHRGQNNFAELAPRVARLLQRSAGPGGWAPGRDDAADPDARHRYFNRFVAVKRGVPIVPRWDPDADLPPLRSLTARVAGPDGEAVHTDALGRVKVQILGLDPAEHRHAQGAGTSGSDRDSAWVRVANLWAGPGMGLSFPLRAGMEATLEFEHGDPDRPVIARVHYNADQPPPRFSDAGALPLTRYLSGIKSREIGGHRWGQLVFDDTTGQVSVQLASAHGASRLMLGELRTPRGAERAAPLGEGFYLSTDESGAIRTARSLLLTAWQRLERSGAQLDAQEHLALLDDCVELFARLREYAAQHQALDSKPQPLADLKADIVAARAGSNTDPQARGGAPSISITAPAGVATTTPKTLLQYAGVDIAAVAQQNIELVAGQRLVLDGGKGVSLFAHHDGLRAIAHHGALLLQSQHDDTRVESARDITLAAQGTIRLMAKSIQLVANDGSFVTLADALTLASRGSVASKGAAFPHSGPASMDAELPRFDDAPADQKFVLRYGGAANALIAANRRYRATLSDGSVVEGRTDGAGRTELLQRDAMHVAQIELVEEPA